MITIDEMRMQIGESVSVTWGVAAETPEILIDYIEGLVGQLRESSKDKEKTKSLTDKAKLIRLLDVLGIEYAQDPEMKNIVCWQGYERVAGPEGSRTIFCFDKNESFLYMAAYE